MPVESVPKAATPASTPAPTAVPAVPPGQDVVSMTVGTMNSIVDAEAEKRAAARVAAMLASERQKWESERQTAQQQQTIQQAVQQSQAAPSGLSLSPGGAAAQQGQEQGPPPRILPTPAELSRMTPTQRAQAVATLDQRDDQSLGDRLLEDARARRQQQAPVNAGQPLTNIRAGAGGFRSTSLATRITRDVDHAGSQCANPTTMGLIPDAVRSCRCGAPGIVVGACGWWVQGCRRQRARHRQVGIRWDRQGSVRCDRVGAVDEFSGGTTASRRRLFLHFGRPPHHDDRQESGDGMVCAATGLAGYGSHRNGGGCNPVDVGRWGGGNRAVHPAKPCRQSRTRVDGEACPLSLRAWRGRDGKAALGN